MKILVTGAGGFVGRHLVRELAENGHEPVAADISFSSPVEQASSQITLDLTNAENVNKAVESTRPEACAHLGALAFIPTGEANPDPMLTVNILGTLHVLNALKESARDARILAVSSALVYGASASGQPLNEDAPIAPLTIYAASKAAADLHALAYAREYNMHIMTARPNNHTGPGQASEFAIPSFARQVQEAIDNKSPILVGNLDSKRDFTDVRDVVRAYRLLLEQGNPGNAYNISSGKMLTMGEILNTLCSMKGLSPEIQQDPSKFRPTDSSPLLDISKLQNDTGWTPAINFTQTLKDVALEL